MCLWCLAPQNPYPTLSSCFNGPMQLCNNCQKRLQPIDKVIQLKQLKVTSFYEYDQNISSLLYQYKEIGDKPLAKVFVYKHQKLLKKLAKHHHFVVMPSSQKHLLQRGFHHLLEILESIGIDGINCFEKENDIFQKELTVAERQKIKLIYHPFKMTKPKIILFDDVMTTGSTLLQAYAHLEKRTVHAIVLSLVSLNVV